MNGRTLLLLCASIAVALWAGPSSSAPQPMASAKPKCEPGSREVAVFAERDFQGTCALQKTGLYATTMSMGLGNQPLRSIKLGAFAAAMVCGINIWREFKCESVTFSTGSFWDDFRTYLQVADERVIRDRCRPAKDEVVIIGEKDASVCVKLIPGLYPDADSMHLVDPETAPGFADAGSASIERRRREGALTMIIHNVRKIVSGAQARAYVCKEKGFGGVCYEIRAESDSPPGAARSLEPEWPVRSMKVFPDCELHENTAVIYAGIFGQDQCAELVAGTYPTPGSLRLRGAAGQSLKLGTNVAAIACTEESLLGDCFEIPPGATERMFWPDDLRPYRVPQDKVMRSLQLRLRQAAEAPPK